MSVSPTKQFIFHKQMLAPLCVAFFILTSHISPMTSKSHIISQAHADSFTSLDPLIDSERDTDDGDDSKTAPELVREANYLFIDEKPLEARVRLFKALERDKNYYPTYILLGEYYIEHVGHFRLALKYIKRATELFYEQKGQPPFDDVEIINEHARLLYLLTQVRLNLDDYQGSLQVLDEFASHGYYGNWYPATRAWVLMKLGDIKEAIAVAKTGLLMGADDGRTLNMLGILLSLDNNPEEALKVLRSAIAFELSQGRNGRPATPLNNSGEVYRELYEDDKAESSWKKALRLPDGCEHILPTVNLSLLLMEQLRISETQQALDDFISCVSQYTLRNGEEHKALESLFRARVELASGRPLNAQDFLQSSLQGIQWFGKIGTNKEDLEVAALVTMAESLKATNAILATTVTPSYIEALDNFLARSLNTTKRWWLLRKARGLLVDTLKNIEDLHIRNTDSMLDYPSLGEVLSSFPPERLKQRIDSELTKDLRQPAKLAYDLYYAESLANHGQLKQGLELAQNISDRARPRYDDSIALRARVLLASNAPRDSEQYLELSHKIFNMLRPSLRLNSLPLPVKIASNDKEISALLSQVGFLPSDSGSVKFEIRYIQDQDDQRLELVTTGNASSNLAQTVIASVSLRSLFPGGKSSGSNSSGLNSSGLNSSVNRALPTDATNINKNKKAFEDMTQQELTYQLVNEFSNQVFSLAKR